MDRVKRLVGNYGNTEDLELGGTSGDTGYLELGGTSRYTGDLELGETSNDRRQREIDDLQHTLSGGNVMGLHFIHSNSTNSPTVMHCVAGSLTWSASL